MQALSHAPAYALLTLVLASATSCQRLDARACNDGSLCPSGFTCVPAPEDTAYQCMSPSMNARCDQTLPSDLFDREDYQEHLLVGTIFDRSEPLIRLYEASAVLAFQQANDMGGVNGHRFGVISCTIEPDDGTIGDDRGFEDAAEAVADHLVELVGVHAVVAAGPALR